MTILCGIVRPPEKRERFRSITANDKFGRKRINTLTK